jgi:uncharacterized protein
MLANTLMRQPNNSVPSLPSEHPLRYADGVEHAHSRPSFDPNSAIDQFANLRISDPIARSGTSMSMQSKPPLQNSVRHPRHANTLPASHYHGPPPMGPGDHYPADSTPSYTRDSGNYPQDILNNYAEGDRTSGHSYDDPGRTAYAGHGAPDAAGMYPPVAPQHPWQNSQNMIPPEQGYQVGPYPGEYNPLVSAASSVLGIGPPPGSNPAARLAYPVSNPPYQESEFTSPSGSYHPHPGPPSNASFPSGEFDPRPSLRRSETSASVTLRTQKSKAVDLSAPLYTKDYIDQYRQRIKADPDPEAHFLYAKFLIEAAKRMGAEARDQRAWKKYRDLLITESLKVIRRLATQGQAYDEAQFFLANCYGTGMLGLQVDHERAYHLYLQAAKQNHAAACYRVAVCNEIGAGTRREPPRAAAFYRKAASLGDTPAMYKLGMILLRGSLGDQKNPREAINWLKRAAEQADEENPHALHELGLLHEVPNSQLVLYDPGYAVNLFTQAAHLGYTQSQYKLGQCYEYGSLTCPVDPRRSIAWYTKAAEKGFPEAELALSGWYLTGSEGVLKQSDSEAYLWARRAANKGLSTAEYAVGYYAEIGIGVEADVEFAKRWYMRAAGVLGFNCVNYVD